jgi:hypothetical protein
MWIANIKIALENANYFNSFNKIRQYFCAPVRLEVEKCHLTGWVAISVT